ncbi:MFS transporter, partial [Micromonospora sp. NPDC005173]
SLLGGALLPTSGARPLALVGGLLTLVALTLLAVDAWRGRTAGPAPTATRPSFSVRMRRTPSSPRPE